ncbi:hypothetical protein KEU06_20715 [Pseudaminobacter sp. 19-2017]|uniref:Uncharacterized protein n=1 Tax=Pseudaminobacter soli (ex Zhang et al. 2022) TaxID=2831468 RepID=A0A942E181_9HYPH|nr:hypothetical protein [Pseudaminobacter soli]MBS3651037.1 hypothetical protein [Pseudaminobacter soli]
MRKAHSAANRPEQRTFTDEEFDADDVGVVALAERLNIQRYAVSDIARRVGVDPNRPSPRTKVGYAPDEVEKIEQFAKSLVTYAEATKALGLPRYQIKPLVDAGFLQSIPGICGSRSLGLVRSEVDDLLRTTMEGIPVVPSSGTHGLTTAASLMGIEAGLLATFVVAGEIRPVGRAEGPLAFRSLRFTPSGNLPPDIIGTRKRKPRDRKKELGSGVWRLSG